ncbi:unnamed protein product, partial [Rangifer tarandus platyrhynchus]
MRLGDPSSCDLSLSAPSHTSPPLGPFLLHKEGQLGAQSSDKSLETDCQDFKGRVPPPAGAPRCRQAPSGQPHQDPHDCPLLSLRPQWCPLTTSPVDAQELRSRSRPPDHLASCTEAAALAGAAPPGGCLAIASAHVASPRTSAKAPFPSKVTSTGTRGQDFSLSSGGTQNRR